MTINSGTFVEHRTDLALGQGRVSAVDKVAGIVRVSVKWASKPDKLFEHTIEELNALVPLPERLASVGPASRVPFQLRVLGRWFEDRHGLTGELSNQPFQMLPHQVIV